MKQTKKTPGLLVCRPGVLISSLNFPGIAPGYYALALVGFSFEPNTMPDTYI